MHLGAKLLLQLQTPQHSVLAAATSPLLSANYVQCLCCLRQTWHPLGLPCFQTAPLHAVLQAAVRIQLAEGLCLDESCQEGHLLPEKPMCEAAGSNSGGVDWMQVGI